MLECQVENSLKKVTIESPQSFQMKISLIRNDVFLGNETNVGFDFLYSFIINS